MLADRETGWHRETHKHLAHIMRQGRTIGASLGRGGAGGVVGGRSYWNVSVLSVSPRRHTGPVCRQVHLKDGSCRQKLTYIL